MHREEPKINCLAFQRQEGIIRDLTDKINSAKTVQEKAKFAQDLQKEADVLLSCAGYKSESLDCESCHFIANLRKRATNIILKAKKLA